MTIHVVKWRINFTVNPFMRHILYIKCLNFIVPTQVWYLKWFKNTLNVTQNIVLLNQFSISKHSRLINIFKSFRFKRNWHEVCSFMTIPFENSLWQFHWKDVPNPIKNGSCAALGTLVNYYKTHTYIEY